MDGYGDGLPRRLVLLVGGVAACLVASDLAGAGVLSAFAASATDGAVGTPLGGGMALVDEAVEFLVGVAVAAAVLGLLWIGTGGFEG